LAPHICVVSTQVLYLFLEQICEHLILFVSFQLFS